MRSRLESYRVQTAIGILAGAALALVLAPIVLFVAVVMARVFTYSGAWP